MAVSDESVSLCYFLNDSGRLELSRWDSVFAAQTIPLQIFFIILFASGTVGNGLVAYIYFRKHNKTSAIYFILFLAIIDLFVCLTVIPFTMFSESVFRFSFTNEPVCKIFEWFRYSSLSISCIALGYIAVDRYFAICHPLSFIMRPYRVKCMICLSCIAGSVFQTQTLDIFGIKTTHITDTDIGCRCDIRDRLYGGTAHATFIALLICLYAVLFVIISISYILVYRTIRQRQTTKQTTRVSPVESLEPPKHETLCCLCRTLHGEERQVSVNNKQMKQHCCLAPIDLAGPSNANQNENAKQTKQMQRMSPNKGITLPSRSDLGMLSHKDAEFHISKEIHGGIYNNEERIHMEKQKRAQGIETTISENPEENADGLVVEEIVSHEVVNPPDYVENSHQKHLKEGKGPDSNRPQGGKGPDSNRPQEGKGPDSNRLQEGKGPEANRLQEGKGPDSNRLPEGKGPEANRLQEGKGPEANRLHRVVSYGEDSVRSIDFNRHILASLANAGKSGQASTQDDRPQTSRGVYAAGSAQPTLNTLPDVYHDNITNCCPRYLCCGFFINRVDPLDPRLWGNPRALHLTESTTRAVTGYQRARYKSARILLAVTIVFLLSWFPVWVVHVASIVNVNFWANLTPGMANFLLIIRHFHFINSAANPFIYAFLDKKFRDQVKITFSGCWKHLKNNCQKK